jgi:tetratricopeptide (TPR) repeat protein
MKLFFKSVLKTTFTNSALLVLVLITFARALSFGLVWDDHLFIKEPYTTNIMKSGLESFTQGYIQVSAQSDAEAYYRPLTSFLFKIENYFFRGEPVGYHLINIILHLLNVLLLRRLLVLITGSKQIAFLAAALFAVFPLNAESVVWISGRTDLLATTFILSALLYHTRQISKKENEGKKLSSWVLVILFACAVLSKESGYVLLLLLPAMGILISEENFSAYLNRFKLCYISLFLSALIFIAIRTIILPGGFAGHWFYPNVPIWLMSVIATLFKYFLKLFYPFNPEPYITNDYVYTFTNVYLIFGLFLLFGLGFIIAKYFKKNRIVSFSIIFIIFSLSPALNILRVGSPLDMGFTMADRYTYLPFCGAALLMAWIINTLLSPDHMEKMPKKRFLSIPKRLYLLSLILIILLGSVNFITSYKYRNDEFFYTSALRKNPASRLLRINLAVHYWKKREYAMAYKQITELKKYCASEDPDVLNIEGVLLYNLNRPAEAIDRFSKAIRLDHNNQFLWHNFGMLYLHLGLPENAMEYFYSSLQKNPHFTEAKIALALTYQRSNRKAEAGKIYEQILKDDPFNPGILTNYGSLLFEMDEQKRGEELLERAISSSPGDSLILYNYARSLVLYTDKLDKALEITKQIMQDDPSFPALYVLMSEIYTQKREYNRALRWAYAGLSLSDLNEEIKDNLKLKIAELYEILGIKR